MTTNTTQKEKAAGGLHTTAATTTNDLDYPSATRPNKAFLTLRAAYAIKGHILHRTNPMDGPVSYYAERWGHVRRLPSLADVEYFLNQIGGEQ